MTRHARAERLALAETMLAAGPGAPTLCGGWTVRDLLAHLLLRERRPDAAVGIMLPRAAGHTARVQERIACGEFTTLLARLRRPPWWSPISNPVLDEPANLWEMFVHHEDVRRAVPDWTPRPLPPDLAQGLWRLARHRARLALRRYPATITVTAHGFGTITTGAGGDSTLTLSGDPGELAMFLSGRQEHCRARVDGPPEAALRLTQARLVL